MCLFLNICSPDTPTNLRWLHKVSLLIMVNLLYSVFLSFSTPPLWGPHCGVVFASDSHFQTSNIHISATNEHVKCVCRTFLYNNSTKKVTEAQMFTYTMSWVNCITLARKFYLNTNNSVLFCLYTRGGCCLCICL